MQVKIVKARDSRFVVIKKDKFTNRFEVVINSFEFERNILMDDFETYNEAIKWCYKFNYPITD